LVEAPWGRPRSQRQRAGRGTVADYCGVVDVLLVDVVPGVIVPSVVVVECDVLPWRDRDDFVVVLVEPLAGADIVSVVVAVVPIGSVAATGGVFNTGDPIVVGGVVVVDVVELVVPGAVI